MFNWSNIRRLFNLFIEKYHGRIIILFLVGFVFRAVFVHVYKPNLFPPDGTGYYRIAVNLLEGNGYSNQEHPPHIPEFSREPAYPVFLASGLFVYDLFGGEVEYLDMDTYDAQTSNLDPVPPSIVFLRLWQSFFDCLTVVFLFLILGQVLKKNLAFFIALLFSLYFPVVFHNVILYREVFQTFILTLLNYFIIRYVLTRKGYFLILAGVAWAISNMTLYATAALLPFLFFYLWRHIGSFRVAFIKTTIVVSIMGACMLPWLINVYSYYPDVRIVKTLGSAATHEWRGYWSIHYDALDWGLITQEEFRTFLDEEAYNRSYTEYFDRSFNGYYNQKTDSIQIVLDSVRNQAPMIKRASNTLEHILRKTVLHFWIKKEWGQQHSLRYYFNERSYVIILLYGITFLLGIISIWGFIKYFRKMSLILLVFYMFLGISMFIGAMERRLLPSYPYVFTFGLLLLTEWLNKARRRFLNSRVDDIELFH